MDPIKITSLHLENVKRIKAVSMMPTNNGLTILGGKNGQGKTSVLDAIAWALGGDKYRPEGAVRDGSVLPPNLEVKLSNGLLVRRQGKSSALTVTDPSGKKYGQTLLNSFVGQFSIDLPKFMEATDKEKADILLSLLGIGDKLRQLDTEENSVYTRRHSIGQIADQKEKYAKEMPFYDGVPTEPVSASELIAQQQTIMAHNAENQRKRTLLTTYEDKHTALAQKREALATQLAELDEQLQQLSDDIETARKDALDLHDESTQALEDNLRDLDELNRKIRANLDKQHADDDARDLGEQYNVLTAKLDDIRKQKRALLDSTELPLPGLMIENGCLTYRGHTWDDMSSSEQLMVGAAIARALQPNCGFILMDKLEQMDQDTLTQFGAWLTDQGLQVIATRVSTGEECTIIIEDGTAEDPNTPETQKPATWQEGEF